MKARRTNIITQLTNKIRNKKEKKVSIAEYIDRYADTFKRWDEESIKAEKKKKDSHSEQLIKAIEVLSDTNVSQYDKYEAGNKLSDNIEFVKAQNTDSLIDIIKAFLMNLIWIK